MFLVWYADAIETSRHAQQIGLQLRIGMLVTLITGLDLVSTLVVNRLVPPVNQAMLVKLPIIDRLFSSQNTATTPHE